MILSDRTIQQLINVGELKIHPIKDKLQIQPASIDLRLGRHYLKINENKSKFLSLEEKPYYQVVDADKFVLPPKSFVLATTIEYVKIPNWISGFVEGRSSIGRMGLFIQNAGWVDPGFEGQITLELYNANNLPIVLDVGRRICQLVLAEMDQPVLKAYSGKYQKQKNATGSKASEDLD
jgi:dCTP deaminase